MAYCTNCGAKLPDNAYICPECGISQVTGSATVPESDEGGILWGLLGCCIPIVGLVLYLVWKATKPNSAKAAGIGALVCVIINVVFYILALVLGIGSAALSTLILF